MRETEKSWLKAFYKITTIILQTVKVIINKENLKNFHSQKKDKEA